MEGATAAALEVEDVYYKSLRRMLANATTDVTDMSSVATWRSSIGVRAW
jgi:hypothetical protein